MNKVFIIPVIIIAVFSCIQSSCKKNDVADKDELPPLTFTGANTIGCRINGVPWIPRGVFGGGVAIYPVDGGFYVNNFDPFLSGIHILISTNSTDGYIELFCRNYSGVGFLKPGKYFFNKNTGDITFGYGERHSYGFYNFNGKTYFTDSLHTGFAEILKADSVTGIISGRFQFEAYNTSDGKIYKITEGRFDIK